MIMISKVILFLVLIVRYQPNDRGRLDFGWWVHSAMHRWCSIELYTYIMLFETEIMLLNNITSIKKENNPRSQV